MRVRPRALVHADQHQQRIKRNRTEGIRCHSLHFAFAVYRNHGDSGGEIAQRFTKVRLSDIHRELNHNLRKSYQSGDGGPIVQLPRQAQRQLNLTRVEYGARRAI